MGEQISNITKANPGRHQRGQQPAHHPRAPRPSVGTPGHSAPGGRAETPGWGISRAAGHGQSAQGFHRSRSRTDHGAQRGQERTESRRLHTPGASAGSRPSGSPRSRRMLTKSGSQRAPGVRPGPTRGVPATPPRRRGGGRVPAEAAEPPYLCARRRRRTRRARAARTGSRAAA